MNNNSIYYPWDSIQTKHSWNEEIITSQTIRIIDEGNGENIEGFPILTAIFCVLIYDIILTLILSFKD